MVLIYQGISAFLMLILACFILIKNKANNINRTFFIFSVFILGFIISNFLLEYFTQANEIGFALFAYRLAAMFGSLTVPAVVCFAWYFPFEIKKINSFMILFVYLIGIISAVLSFTELYIKGISAVSNGIRIMSFGRGYYFFALFPWLFVFYCLSILRKKYIETDSIVKKIQIKYVYVGILLGYIVALIFNLDIPVLWTSKFEGIGPLGPIFLVICAAYAILKHDLMDIRVIINRTGAWVLTIIFLASGYLLGVFFYTAYISQKIDALLIAWTILYGLFVGEFHQKIRFFIQTTAERKFLKSRYDYRKVLSRMSEKLTGCKTMGDIVKVINTDFVNEIEARSVRIYLVNENE